VAVGTIETDITRQKEMIEALSASEKRIRMVADSMPGLLGYVDSDLRFQFCNELFEVWFQRPRSQIIGHKLDEVFSESQYEIARREIEPVLRGDRVGA
jgi:PAS domain-containing protein